jgi:hypothetical protein
MSLRFTQRLRNQLSTPIGHALLSKRKDDAYIAAFPRSGSTWLRTILVNILDPSANSNPDVFNARIPAVSIRNAGIINRLPSPRLIMTHSNWRPSINKAVYLVRDGRDAFISSYHYHVTRNDLDMSIGTYFELYKQHAYGQTWESHVQSWFKHGESRLGKALLVIRFEDLKHDTKGCVLRVCAFLGIEAKDTQVQQAIALASLDNAKKIELQRQGNIKDNNASFYREGRNEQWKNPQYREVISDFESEADSALKLIANLKPD